MKDEVYPRESLNIASVAVDNNGASRFHGGAFAFAFVEPLVAEVEGVPQLAADSWLRHRRLEEWLHDPLPLYWWYVFPLSQEAGLKLD